MVKLVKRGKVATLQEWNAFQAAYLNKGGLVEDWSDAEDQRLVFNQIPRKYHQRVINDLYKRTAGQHLVRVTVPNGLSAHEVQ